MIGIIVWTRFLVDASTVWIWTSQATSLLSYPVQKLKVAQRVDDNIRSTFLGWGVKKNKKDTHTKKLQLNFSDPLSLVVSLQHWTASSEADIFSHHILTALYGRGWQEVQRDKCCRLFGKCRLHSKCCVVTNSPWQLHAVLSLGQPLGLCLSHRSNHQW